MKTQNKILSLGALSLALTSGCIVEEASIQNPRPRLVETVYVSQYPSSIVYPVVYRAEVITFQQPHPAPHYLSPPSHYYGHREYPPILVSPDHHNRSPQGQPSFQNPTYQHGRPMPAPSMPSSNPPKANGLRRF